MSTGYGRRGQGTALLQALNAPTRCPVQGDDEGATSKDSVLVSSGRGGSLASLLGQAPIGRGMLLARTMGASA